MLYDMHCTLIVRTKYFAIQKIQKLKNWHDTKLPNARREIDASVMSNIRKKNKEGSIALRVLCLVFCSEAYCAIQQEKCNTSHDVVYTKQLHWFSK